MNPVKPKATPQGDEMTAAYEGGQGSPLVLLHGICGSWHIWKPVLDRLTPHHRVIAITLPGHPGGPPLPPEEPVTVECIRQALEDELDRRGIDKAHFAGNSLGGWLSLEMARRGRALSVTAFSPAGAWSRHRDVRRLQRLFRFAYAVLPVTLALLGWASRFSWVRRLLGGLTMRRPQNVPGDEFLRNMRTMRNTRLLPEFLANLRFEHRIQPMNASVPTTISWCEHDKVIPLQRYGLPMYEAVTGARQSRLADAGHVPMYDQPESMVASILETTRRVDS
ncbi:MAG: alpha/beta fold hydrolase [Panacagrimonas sp.]